MTLGYLLQCIGVVLCSFLLGAFVVACAVAYLVHQYTKHLPRGKGATKFAYEKVAYGELLHQSLHGAMQTSVPGQKESCNFINILLLFLFREWRDTAQLQRWVLKKVNIEIQEFMDTKAAGRLLHGIKVHDLSMGKNFPVFHNAVIKEPVAFSDSNPPEKIVLDFDMEYTGGLRLAVDVDLAFGKSAFLAVCVSFLKGRARLIFDRSPCTHWSIAFVAEPEIKFDIETSFENLQLPQVASLIVNQMKRTLRRKHTLPYYKLRYNPLFSFQHPEKSEFDGFVENISLQPSVLEVSIDACTRLLAVSKAEKEHPSSSFVVFCTLSVDEVSCVGVTLFKTNLPVPTNQEESLHGTGGTPTDTEPKLASKSSFSLNDIQKSFRSLRKSTNDLHERSRSASPSMKHNHVTTSANEDKASSSSNKAYLMIMPGFTATLKEEIRDDQKIVIVSQISSQESGIQQADEIVAINKEEITSLSHAIVVASKIRKNEEAFVFRVKRQQVKRTASDKSLNKETGQLERDDEIETDSDHSDVEVSDETSNEVVRVSSETSSYHKISTTSDNTTNNDIPQTSSLMDHTTPYLTLSEYTHTKMKEIKVANRSRTPSPRQRKTNQNSGRSRSDVLPNHKLTKERASSLVLPELLSEEAYRISSAFCDLSDQPVPFPIPSRPGESLQFARVTNNDQSQLFKTSLSQYDGSNELSWKSETFLFNIKENHRYLNIRMWTQKMSQSSIATDKPPQIVGCLSVPLCNVELVCSTVSSHRVTQRYRVNAPTELPSTHKWYMASDFSQRSSFRDQYCHGDVTLTTRLVTLTDVETNNNNSNNRKSETAENDSVVAQEDDDVQSNKESQPQVEAQLPKDHTVALHSLELYELHSRFTKHNRCDYCRKKMWLKTVMRCSKCHNMFHPNCAAKLKDNAMCESLKHEGNNSQQDQATVEESEADNKLLQQRSDKFSKTSEDLLAVQAKDCGRDLHRDMPTAERRLMLGSLLIKVETELHTEIVDKESLLTEQCNMKVNSREWKILENKIVKSDEKLQSLALLMIYYKSGLEDCEEGKQPQTPPNI